MNRVFYSERADITSKAAFFQPLLIFVMVKYILPIHTGFVVIE